MNTGTEFEELLTNGDWRAVELAKNTGNAAWGAIEKAMEIPVYQVRQIAVVCAGRIGGNKSASILVAGLSDPNVNVRLAAAKQLTVNPPAKATDAVLASLETSTENDVRELLALAAGYLPGDRTIEVLQPLAQQSDVLGQNALLALAKLGQQQAMNAILKKLTAEEARTRYETLAQLRYLHMPTLVQYVKPLLQDRAEALLIGPERNRRFRRVCDQAVDTLVFLLRLSVPFPVSVENIYSDEEIKQIVQLAK